MNIVAISEAERAALAARLGVAVERVPTHRTIVPRGVSGMAPGEAIPLRGAKRYQLMARRRQMQALKEREERAVREAEAKRVKAEERERRAFERALERKSRERKKVSRAKPKTEWAPHMVMASKTRWALYELLHMGETPTSVAEMTGLPVRRLSYHVVILKKRGEVIPDLVEAAKARRRENIGDAPKGERRDFSGVSPTREMIYRRRWAMYELLHMGCTVRGASDMMGLNRHSGESIVEQLRKRGETLPNLRSQASKIAAAQRMPTEAADKRRREVWSMVCAGLTTRQIAARVGVSDTIIYDVYSDLRAEGKVIPDRRKTARAA